MKNVLHLKGLEYNSPEIKMKNYPTLYQTGSKLSRLKTEKVTVHYHFHVNQIPFRIL